MSGSAPRHSRITPLEAKLSPDNHKPFDNCLTATFRSWGAAAPRCGRAHRHRSSTVQLAMELHQSENLHTPCP